MAHRLFGTPGASRVSDIALKSKRFFPGIAILGLLSSLVEGTGISALLPLISMVTSGETAERLPPPFDGVALYLSSLTPLMLVIVIGLFLTLVTLVRGGLHAASRYLTSKAEIEMATRLRHELAAKLLTLDYDFFLEREESRPLQVLSTHSWGVIEAYRAGLLMIPAIASVLAISLWLIWLNWSLFLILLLGGAVIALMVSRLNARQRKHSRAAAAANRDLGKAMLATVMAARPIRIYGQEERELERFDTANRALGKATLLGRLNAAPTGPLIGAALAILFLILLVAAQSWQIALAQATMFFVLVIRLEPHAAQLAQSRTGILSSIGAIEETEWLLGQEKSNQPASLAKPDLGLPIRFADVAFAYADGNQALRNASFELVPGTITAMVGPSGAGKTTIVNMIARLLPPSSGAIYLGESDLADFEPSAVRSQIALAGQDLPLLPGTIAEAISYAAPVATQEEVVEASIAAGAHGFITSLPEGYQTRLGYDGSGLSVGQRQRIVLASALLRRPKLLILDEATSAVDSLTEEEFSAVLERREFFQTALVIGHRHATISACTHAIVLEDGIVTEAGPLADLAYFQGPQG